MVAFLCACVIPEDDTERRFAVARVDDTVGDAAAVALTGAEGRASATSLFSVRARGFGGVNTTGETVLRCVDETEDTPVGGILDGRLELFI